MNKWQDNVPADEYYISFTTDKGGAPAGTIDAIRVRIDMVRVTNMNKPMRVDLCDHPLYPDLKKYVKAND